MVAKLFRDTETFGKMDPYVSVRVGNMKVKTKTHQSGGKAPKWNDTLQFELENEDTIDIAVYDEDTVTDDLVGETTLFLDEIKKRKSYDEWVKISYKGKEAGQVQ